MSTVESRDPDANYILNSFRLIDPIMKERRAAMQKGSSEPKVSDMIQWIIDNSDERNGKNTKFVTKTQMLISVVAIHTTTMTVIPSFTITYQSR